MRAHLATVPARGVCTKQAGHGGLSCAPLQLGRAGACQLARQAGDAATWPDRPSRGDFFPRVRSQLAGTESITFSAHMGIEPEILEIPTGPGVYFAWYTQVVDARS